MSPNRLDKIVFFLESTRVSLHKKAAIFLAAPALFSCLLNAQGKVLKDDMGNIFILRSPPQRIISLAPNITEILFALGLGGRVVGVTRYCDYPAEALKREKIGGMLDPDIERISVLAPDLIIAFRGNPLSALKKLQDLRLPVFILDIGMDLPSVYPLIAKIGRVTFKEIEAHRLVQSLKKKYDSVERALQGITQQPRVFLNIHGLGLSTCGRESYFNDLLARAKGVNIAGGVPQNWLEYNREQFLKDNPDVIVILTRSQRDFEKAKVWLKAQSGFSRIQAIGSGRVYFLDENPASRFGPRLFDALLELARLLHPQQFAKQN
jgi:iron complex transport system substrate-binding protein